MAASAFRVWTRLAGAQFRSETQFRVSFGFTILTRIVVTLTEVVSVLALFSVVDRLGGWTQSQVLLLAAGSTLSFGIADLVASPVELTSQYVRTGQFDRMLVRPASVYVQLLGKEFAARRVARPIQAIILLGLVLAIGDVPPGNVALRSILFVLMVLGGACAMSGVFALTSALAFWSPNTQELANAFTYGGAVATQYPLHIFGGWVRRVVLFALPLGVVSYMPAIYVVRGANPLDIPVWVQWLGPAASLPVAALGLWVWHIGLRHYEGTGS